jgi:predicted transcriptional regulator
MADLLRVVRRRRRILEYLSGRAASKRDLVAETSNSRSTVDRAISELSSYDMVERVNGGFRTTTPGRLCLDAVAEVTETFDVICGASEVLSHLPPEAPVPHRFLVGASVVTSDPTAPAAGVDGVLDSLRRADGIRGFSVADNDSRWSRALYERATSGALTADVVVTEPMANYLLDRYADWIDGVLAADSFRIRVRETLPFGLFLLDVDGRTTAHLLIHDERSSFLARIENDRPEAVSWAESCFEGGFEAGVPFEEFLG